MIDKSERLVKIIMIGESGVGKTCLAKRLTEKTIDLDHFPTIGVDFVSKTYEFENLIMRMQIWDTAGQEVFHNIISSYYKGSLTRRARNYDLLLDYRQAFFRKSRQMDGADQKQQFKYRYHNNRCDQGGSA